MELVKQGDAIVEFPVNALGAILQFLAGRGKLDKTTINELGTIGRSCAGVDSPLSSAVIKYAFEVFDSIRLILEPQLQGVNALVYIEVRKQAESIVKWLEDSQPRRSDREHLTESGRQYLSRFQVLDETALQPPSIRLEVPNKPESGSA
ncbi:MAG: hypothetical protein ACE15E_24375 [Acidobacteriota bacterium]